MLQKVTKKLFRGTYQHKIVLVCPGAGMFRNNNLESTLLRLKLVNLNDKNYNAIRTKEDLDYALALRAKLAKMADYDLRVEGTWISFYTNKKSDINALIKLDESHVKYVSSPEEELTVGEIIMPKIPFDYKVTVGKTTSNCIAFVEWAEKNPKIRITKSCMLALSKDFSWGGTYFYVTGDNLLLMAKMHLGGAISKIERIIKSKS